MTDNKIPTLRKAVLDTARDYIGQEEIGNNESFKDKVFLTKMKQAGWQVGHAWCSYFVELCYTEPIYEGKSKVLEFLQKNFHGSVDKTMKNFLKNSKGQVIFTKEPRRGDIAIFKKYKDGYETWMGHMAIYEKTDGENRIHTIDGNTNTEGGRNGFEVGKIRRDFSFTPKQNGLVLIGFFTVDTKWENKLPEETKQIGEQDETLKSETKKQ